MRTYLRHGVHMCLIDGGAIFLDLASNAYLGIDAPTRAALTKCLAGLSTPSIGVPSEENSGVPAAVATLVERGLLTDAEPQGQPFSPLTPSMTHAVSFGVGRCSAHVGLIHLARFVRALIRTRIMLRRGDILALTARLRTRKAHLSLARLPEDAQSVIVLVHIFRRLSAFFYTAKDACLLDSIVLAEFLISHGHEPTLILGVRTKPFFAHAWAQMGSCVLNDSIEHAQTLTPIAAI